MCKPHQCVCCSIVVARGSNALSCKCSGGRIQHHHHINDLVWQAMSRAGIAAIKEPHCLTRPDGKWLDMVWRVLLGGRADEQRGTSESQTTVATTLSLDGSAAEAASLHKEAKYTDFSHSYSFFLLPLKLWAQSTSKAFHFIHRSATKSQQSLKTLARFCFCFNGSRSRNNALTLSASTTLLVTLMATLPACLEIAVCDDIKCCTWVKSDKFGWMAWIDRGIDVIRCEILFSFSSIVRALCRLERIEIWRWECLKMRVYVVETWKETVFQVFLTCCWG
jgi:hypothetical protein